jgi:hypothetical protein
LLEAEMDGGAPVIDRDRPGLRQHIHPNQQGRLVRQLPNVKDVKIADVGDNIACFDWAKQNARQSDGAIEYDRFAGCVGANGI